jgi:hypothetical protein
MPLVTTLDGTQTFGWSFGAAQFSTLEPTLTTPPYTELEFPLYLKPARVTYPDVIAAVFRSLRQPPTPLNTAFFGKQNVDALQAALRDGIVGTMGLLIERQSDWEMLLLMRRVYLETANNWPDNVDEEVQRLNSMVLLEAGAAVSRNISQYMAYRSTLPMPVEVPDPAESLTTTPFPMDTGTPTPMRNLNAEYEEGVRAFDLSRPSTTLAPLPGTVAAASAPQTSTPVTSTPLWTTAPPREI